MRGAGAQPSSGFFQSCSAIWSRASASASILAMAEALAPSAGPEEDAATGLKLHGGER